ncbi:LysR family transcriptional regulator [Guptibacillus hwajinpoensis]|uniref:DNA-binding transcriptional LysR family regulator n=1 Tax=Guptibacillus hwajinpoensis TaxID=208199 RepID=A0ABU0K2X2_9BACL|nr:LysR family transcriptional regulator [Alkalihalobacillus hemicentroti]MDQ0483705.1 DNA-binding transcriptional LysR family regulator [Alkalihalobacillus hemicentroti]
MTLVKYEIFSKVAELNSFTKTAKALNITQSAVSHAINSLEKEFALPLFIRNHSSIKLTDNAERLLIHVRQMLHQNNLLHEEVNAINGLIKGKVRLGVFSSVTTTWIPSIMKEMEKQFPHITIELREGNYAEIKSWLMNGEVDSGFVNNIEQLDTFNIKHLKQDRLLCIVSAQSPLQNEIKLSKEQVEEAPFIMPAFQCYEDIQIIFKENNIEPAIKYENMSENSVVSMVENNLGISIMPEMVVPKNVHSIKAIPLECDSYRTISLATRKNASPASKKLSATIERLVPTMNLS